MNNTIRRNWNMFSMVNIEDLRGNAFQNEDGGHTFEIAGLDANGNTVALSGNVSAVFLRADNTDVAIVGSISGGRAKITLPDECYEMPGRFGLTIYLASDGQTAAIYAAIGTVHKTSSGTVSPGTQDSVEDLIAAIEAAIASIPADYATLNKIAEPVTETIQNDYRNVEMPVNTSANGWRLISDTGLCVSNSSYKIVKYKVDAGTLYHIVSDDMVQFQNSAQVPATGTSNRIGSTYANGEFYFIAPTGASFLIFSTPTSGSTAYCERCDYKEAYETLDYKIVGKYVPNLHFAQEDVNGTTGQVANGTQQIHTGFIYVGKTNTITFTISSGYKAYVRWYNDANYNSFVSGENDVSGTIVALADYVVIGLYKSDFSTITPSSGSNISVTIYGNHPTEEPYIYSVVESGDPYNKNKFVNVDLVNNTITFSSSDTSGRTYIRYGNNQVNITGKTVSIDSLGGYAFIYYQISTDSFVVINSGTNLARTKTNDYIYIGATLGNQHTVNLKVYPFYYVNGAMTTYEDSRNNFDAPKYYRDTQNIAVLGDSTSTYNGISESEIGGRAVRGAYYPYGNVDDSSLMWWSKLQKMLRMGGSIAVSAISRSSYRQDLDTSEMYAPAMWNSERISNLSANTPHYIFVNAGLNDGFNSESSVGTFSYEHDVSIIETEAVTIARGIELTIRKIQNANPGGCIVLMIPYTVKFSTTDYKFKTYYKMCELIRQIGESYGVTRIIDLRKCGIHNGNYSYYTIDGIHPNKFGMEKIAEYIYYCLTGSEQIVQSDTD